MMPPKRARGRHHRALAAAAVPSVPRPSKRAARFGFPPFLHREADAITATRIADARIRTRVGGTSSCHCGDPHQPTAWRGDVRRRIGAPLSPRPCAFAPWGAGEAGMNVSAHAVPGARAPPCSAIRRSRRTGVRTLLRHHYHDSQRSRRMRPVGGDRIAARRSLARGAIRPLSRLGRCARRAEWSRRAQRRSAQAPISANGAGENRTDGGIGNAPALRGAAPGGPDL